MLKNELEQLVKKLQKEIKELQEFKQSSTETTLKLADENVKLEKKIEQIKKDHSNDEDVWVAKKQKLEQILKDINLMCETHLNVNYPRKEICVVRDNQPQFLQEIEETNDSRFIFEIIHKSRLESPRNDLDYGFTQRF